MRACLVPLDGGPAIDLVKDITLIGRKDFCDIRLNHASVSKVHLVIVKRDGVLLFRDLGSTNGTKVNGQRVIRGALLPNDKLSIAACKYRIQMGPDTEVPQAQPVEEPQPVEGSPEVRVIVARKDSDMLVEPPAPAAPKRRGVLDTDKEEDQESPRPPEPETPYRSMPSPVPEENRANPSMFVD
jgi:pSer/pThr/pTyr-binding forkhead associated (FHA) protein